MFEWLNESSLNFLKDGYIKKNETVQQRLKDISLHAEKILNKKDFAEKFYNYMAKGYFSLSSPVWSNFGRDYNVASISCFGSHCEDSMDKILYTASEVGMQTKYGGGTSVYMNDVRPAGAAISGEGISDGVIPFIRIFETNTSVCKQADVRRGSCAVYVDIEHGDIDAFIKIRNPGNSVQKIFPAVNIRDYWLKEMEAGEYSKRQIWASLMKSRIVCGTPYIIFHDNVNNNKPECYKNSEINGSNLCVSASTSILTDSGYELIGDLEGSFVNVWNGSEWSNVQIIKTGSNQHLVRVTTDSGYSLDCTPYHKFYVQKGYSRGGGRNKLEISEIIASELKPGDKLIKFDLPIIQGVKELDNAYVNGFYSGDGCLTIQGQRIYLYGEKKKLINKFDIIESWNNQPNQDRLFGHTDVLKDKFFVPDASYTIKSRLEWLSGLCDADGTITNNNGSQSLQIGSVEKEFLKEIQLMLQTLGCDSKISLARIEGEYLLPKNDGSGELKNYNCRDLNRILINGNSLYKLSQLGFKCDRLVWDIKKPNRECSQFIKIESVKPLDGLHDTYCFNEPKKHLGMFNGILTGQCSEIFLPRNKDESFVCCLSSINLIHWDEIVKTDAIETLTYFLDAVMSDFITKLSGVPFMERSVRFAENHRALGMGVIGWHSLLQMKMLSFESTDAHYLNIDIFKTMKERAMQASIDMSKEYGECLMTSGYGRRNTTLLAVAPTTSSSQILGGVSQGIEPFWANYYVKKKAKGTETYKNPVFISLLNNKSKNTPEVWDYLKNTGGSVQDLDFLSQEEKEVFKNFEEINHYAIVRQASARQKFICQGQSLNFKFLGTESAKTISNVCLEAWKSGVKSLYYNHSENSALKLSQELHLCKSCEG